jgi:hypothetical protein
MTLAIDSLRPTTPAPSSPTATPDTTDRPWRPEAEASIERYLSSGDRVAALLDPVWKVCVALIGLILVAWALGLLPAAVRLF